MADLPTAPVEIVGSRAPEGLTSAFGDLKLRNLAPGAPADRWRALLGRVLAPPPAGDR